jgi:serine/threonine-protein kinase
VTINVSQGPRPIQVPKLAGLPQDAAIEQITGLKALVGTVDKQFNATVPSGTVISASSADGKDLSNGGPYFEGMKVNLVVSVGAIPSVKGASVNDATAKLTAVGLHTTPGPQSYSDTVPKDAVISAIPQKEGPVRPGDTLALEVSRGPAPVPVPDNLVGKTWDVVKKTLLDAGFTLKYNALADVAPAAFVVSKVDPPSGTEVPKGSPITVNFAGF